YVGAGRYPGVHRPALEIVHYATRYGYPYPDSGFACSSPTGSFRVKQVSIGADGGLRSLWVLFEQRCGASSAPLTGELRVNANVGVAISAPVRVSVSPGGELSFPVVAENAGGGPALITASGLPPGATFVDHGDHNGNFSWTAS